MIRIYRTWGSLSEQRFLEHSVFPGGEPHVRVEPSQISGYDILIDARVDSANTFLGTLYLLEAVRACRPNSLKLFMPYFPGGQQDRRLPDQEGCCLTAAYNAKLINEFDCNVVTILDPHSTVLTSHIKNVAISSQHGLPWANTNYVGIIQPDRGAKERAAIAAKTMQLPIFEADKIRDKVTNKLSGFRCETLPQNGRYLVVDDICVGGRTFTGLAQVVKQQNPDAILDLYVTHGVFPDGLDKLLQHFDKIYTTDSRPQKIIHDRFKVTTLQAV